MIELRLGDCIEVMKTLPDNSVDSVVCDPPYHLTSTKDGKKGFMGKDWDGGDIAFRTDVWKEVLRVLKPGGHLLAFGGSRTYHRLAVAIEDAGFEIRDQIMWIYGSGFPKSLNIGKSVDKIQGNEREVIGEMKAGKTAMGQNSGWNAHNNITEIEITKGNSDWEGWGTALKPAHEPIVMARKPLSEKTIVENVLKHGTGGINIDDSRIPFDMTDTNPATNPLYRQQNDYKMPEKGQESNGNVSFTSSNNDVSTDGRFPANVIFDEEAGKILDEQTGVLKSGYVAPHHKTKDSSWYGASGQYSTNSSQRNDLVGGASRFFYCPKASKKEKGEFNTHPTIKPIALMEYLIKLITRPNGVVLDCFMGSGSTGVAAKRNGYSFIGIEKEAEYMEIAQQRIDYEC